MARLNHPGSCRASAEPRVPRRISPSADEVAPRGWIGKLVKRWVESDRSVRQHLKEWYVLAINERPEQLVQLPNANI